MIVGCYDPGSKHLGEAILDFPDDGSDPIYVAAEAVEVILSDVGLEDLVRRCAERWARFGVARVVTERVSGLGGDASAAALRARGTALIGASGIDKLLRGAALARGLPVASYPPGTVRAQLALASPGAARSDSDPSRPAKIFLLPTPKFPLRHYALVRTVSLVSGRCEARSTGKRTP
jgi:hypothetical protein